MNASTTRSMLAGLAAGVVAAATLAVAPAAATTSDYNTGYSLGSKAYEYGLPLLDENRVFQTTTSVNVSDGSGNGPVNQFNNLPHLPSPIPSENTIVAPNSDTLYSLAWLDLTQQPQVVHVPAITGRFYVLELVSPWTENFYNITSQPGPASTGAYSLTTGGDFAVVPPGYAGTLPAGVHRIDSPYTRVWIVGRTLIRGESDTAAVNAIQAQYGITPLSEYGHPYSPAPPANPVTTLTFATIPGTGPGEDPLDYFTALDKLMVRFGPMPQDGPLLTQLRAIDVGAGLDPAHDPHLSPDTLRGMRDAVTKGLTRLNNEFKQRYIASSLKHNGYYIQALGTYGTDYQLRAIIDHIGMGTPLPTIAIYPVAQTDRTLLTLSGANSYVLHIPAGQLPPVQTLWSLTMYDSRGLFVPNAVNRYVLNDRSNLHRNANGSIDLYVQHKQPSTAAQVQNWLPAPAGVFRLVWRLYGTGSALPGILDGSGWQPPAVQRCVLGLGVPQLTACAK